MNKTDDELFILYQRAKNTIEFLEEEFKIRKIDPPKYTREDFKKKKKHDLLKILNLNKSTLNKKTE